MLETRIGMKRSAAAGADGWQMKTRDTLIAITRAGSSIVVTRNRATSSAWNGACATSWTITRFRLKCRSSRLRPETRDAERLQFAEFTTDSQRHRKKTPKNLCVLC